MTKVVMVVKCFLKEAGETKHGIHIKPFLSPWAQTEHAYVSCVHNLQMWDNLAK
jgi:hypothetical protein